MSIERRFFNSIEFADEVCVDIENSLSFSRLISAPLKHVASLQDGLDRANTTIREADEYIGVLFTELNNVRSNSWQAERQVKELKEDNLKMNSRNSELRGEMERMSKRIIELQEELEAARSLKNTRSKKTTKQQ